MPDEFARLFEEDQADRRDLGRAVNWTEVSARDSARRQRVEALLAAGMAQTPVDYFHAAIIFQHGDELAHYWRAYELAKYAAEQGHQGARWLTAATFDRWLMRQELPQKYGTQYVSDGEDWRLWEVDPATTDAERAEWDVPSLAQAQRQASDMGATELHTSLISTITLPSLRIELVRLTEAPPPPSPEPLPSDVPMRDLPHYLPPDLTPYKLLNTYCATTSDGLPVLFWTHMSHSGEAITIGWFQDGEHEPLVEMLEIAQNPAVMISGQPDQLTYIVVHHSPVKYWMVCGYLPQDELLRVTESLLRP